MTEVVHEGLVRGVLHRAEGDAGALVLAHGAGSNCNSRLLRAVSEALAASGTTTLRIDLPFRQVRPTGPPHPSSSATDRQAIGAAVALLRRAGYSHVAMGGHSYGGRQASMLAAEEPGAAGALLLLSYPLHPPRRTEQPRTSHWAALRPPVLFVHGTRDPFGSPQELMAAAVEHLVCRHEFLFFERAGHELKPLLQQPQQLVDAWVRFRKPTALSGTAGAGHSSNL